MIHHMTFKQSFAAICTAVCLAAQATAEDCDPEWDLSIGVPGLNARCQSLAVADLGDGPALYIGGDFSTAGGISAPGIVRWDGQTWTSLGSGLGGSLPRPRVIKQWDDGTGPALYVGGDFVMAGGQVVNHIAKWDGKQWQALGNGVVSAGFAPVASIAEFDDGSGEALYVAGNFTSAGGVLNTKNIARWNGQSWLAVSTTQFLSDISSLLVYDDGTGPALVASGTITANVGGTTNLAKWNGTQWIAMVSLANLNGLARGGMVAWDDGSGPALFLCGDGITSVGGQPANHVARWNGTEWSTLNGGLTGGNLERARAIAVFNDGTGEALYAGGGFLFAGGVPVNYVAKWDGTQWSALGPGTGHTVRALVEFNNALFVGGGPFNTAGGGAANNIAAWTPCTRPPTPGDVNGDGIVNISDLLVVISSWGPCTNPRACPSDLNGDDVVNINDLLFVISHWG